MPAEVSAADACSSFRRKLRGGCELRVPPTLQLVAVPHSFHWLAGRGNKKKNYTQRVCRPAHAVVPFNTLKLLRAGEQKKKHHSCKRVYNSLEFPTLGWIELAEDKGETWRQESVLINNMRSLTLSQRHNGCQRRHTKREAVRSGSVSVRRRETYQERTWSAAVSDFSGDKRGQASWSTARVSMETWKSDRRRRGLLRNSRHNQLNNASTSVPLCVFTPTLSLKSHVVGMNP